MGYALSGCCGGSPIGGGFPGGVLSGGGGGSIIGGSCGIRSGGFTGGFPGTGGGSIGGVGSGGIGGNEGGESGSFMGASLRMFPLFLAIMLSHHSSIVIVEVSNSYAAILQLDLDVSRW